MMGALFFLLVGLGIKRELQGSPTPRRHCCRSLRRISSSASHLRNHQLELGGIGKGKTRTYEWFEHVALVGLMFVISVITLFAFCVTIT
jgi:hypothetical protein